MFFNLHMKMTLIPLPIDNSSLITQLTFCTFKLPSCPIFCRINVTWSDHNWTVPIHMIYVSINSFLAPLFFSLLVFYFVFWNYLLFLLTAFFERPKIIVTFFITSCVSILNIFMLPNFFRNSSIFWGKYKKLLQQRIWPIFLGKETFLSGIKYQIFCWKYNFLKKAVFSEKKMRKTIMGNNCKLKI